MFLPFIGIAFFHSAKVIILSLRFKSLKCLIAVPKFIISQNLEFTFLLQFQVSESEEEALDEVDDDVDEEHEHEPEAPLQTESVKKPAEVYVPPKESERQLSKKELKKKELEELDAVLAELGISGQDDSRGNLAFHYVLAF